jgi:membrane protease YdiL (CAAX protease family)
MTSLPPPPPPLPPPSPWRSTQPGSQPPPPVAAPVAPDPPEPRLRATSPWAPWAPLAALFTGLVLAVFGSLLIATVTGTLDRMSDPPPGVNVASTFFQDLAFIGAAIGFAAIFARPTAADFGLVAPARIWRALGLLCAVWAGFYVISALWVTALGLNDTQQLPDKLGADGTTLNAVAVVVLICVVAPLAEEFLFRGFIFGSLRRWGFWPAAIITGVVFGAIHIGSAPIGFVVPLGFFGFGLCLLYERTGSLYPCIALHALNNSIALGASLHYDWQIPVTMVGATAAALAIAWGLGRMLGEQRPPVAAAHAT